LSGKNATKTKNGLWLTLTRSLSLLLALAHTLSLARAPPSSVGCAGPGLARQFISELELQHCMVGYAKSQADMPKWGQLGCSGFIILDAQRHVVCPATAAFLKMRGLAFAHVEALLDALLAAKFSKKSAIK